MINKWLIIILMIIIITIIIRKKVHDIMIISWIIIHDYLQFFFYTDLKIEKTELRALKSDDDHIADDGDAADDNLIPLAKAFEYPEHEFWVAVPEQEILPIT